MNDRHLEGVSRIHIVGAGGAGMSGLAKILAGRGMVVTGSDLKPSPRLDTLGDFGVGTWIGHQPHQMSGVDLVVASSAVPPSDPELKAAAASGAAVWHRPELLEAMTAMQPAIGFTGTHGKTTSAALGVTALRHAGLDPTFLVGGQLVAFNTGAHVGADDIFLLEADEAFGTFRRLDMEALLVTNIESDHLDYYKTVVALEEAFALVASRVSGPVVGCADDQGVRRLARRVDLITYGVDPASDWVITDVVAERASQRFMLESPWFSGPVSIPKPGIHVASNAAGVVALLTAVGYDPDVLAASMAKFAGVRRRFEVRSRVGGVTVVDDYAHHPTEIGATIMAGRQGGWNRVIAVVQPHRYTRVSAHATEFGYPLSQADHTIVCGIDSAGEAPIPGVTGKIVAEAAAAAGGSVSYCQSLTDALQALKNEVSPGDLVLLLGAGNVNSLADRLADHLGAKP